MNNQISVDSDGLIVATGTFTMSGSTGNNDYSGDGNVYVPFIPSLTLFSLRRGVLPIPSVRLFK